MYVYMGETYLCNFMERCERDSVKREASILLLLQFSVLVYEYFYDFVYIICRTLLPTEGHLCVVKQFYSLV
jgi:hypothetical protein